MQTIKEEINGKKAYKKPKGYKPLTKYRSDWYFQDRQTSICKQVYELGQSYYEKMQDPKRRPNHRMKNPVQLVKLFYWLYLTGARQQEAFQTPCTLDIVNSDAGTYVAITHHNEKHKAHKGDIVTEILPIFDEAEQKMWNWITEGGQESEQNQIFKPAIWANHCRRTNITALFKQNFRTTLLSPDGVVHRDAGITPHILRHMRCYNVLHNHHVDRNLAQIWFGWENQLMIDYYAHIRAVMSAKNQLTMLTNKGLLTQLKVDAGKIFTSS